MYNIVDLALALIFGLFSGAGIVAIGAIVFCWIERKEQK